MSDTVSFLGVAGLSALAGLICAVARQQSAMYRIVIVLSCGVGAVRIAQGADKPVIALALIGIGVFVAAYSFVARTLDS